MTVLSQCVEGLQARFSEHQLAPEALRSPSSQPFLPTWVFSLLLMINNLPTISLSAYLDGEKTKPILYAYPKVIDLLTLLMFIVILSVIRG
jgi:hypothetical protein